MVLIVFAVLTVAGQALNVLLCLALDNMFSSTVGALTFVVLYLLTFGVAWILAVRITERWVTVTASPKPSRSGPPGRSAPRRQVLQAGNR